MSCSRGKSVPNDTRLLLFADSAGHCQNPCCLRPLFLDVGGRSMHIAEMAHIFAASDAGPRAQASFSPEARSAYENLILLCPECHTIVDKAPEEYPDSLIREWKRRHRDRIRAEFGAAEYASRHLVREAIEPIMAENRTIFETYGPLGDDRFNPESEVAVVWRRKVLARILPNNRKLLMIIDANRRHLTPAEEAVLERFRQHVDDLEDRHVGGGTAAVGTRFPAGMNELLGGDTGEPTDE